MLALMLAVVLNTPVIPTTTIHFPSGQNVVVAGPGSDAERLKAGETSAWMNDATLLSPRKNVAAVRFCIEHAMESGYILYLAKADGHVQALENSDVKFFFWTTNGRYLIGAGINTVRLWNLSGGVRAVNPTPPLIDPGVVRASSKITRLWIDRSDLCVASDNWLYDAEGTQRGATITTTRYTLPLLKGLTSATYPAGQGRLEADCQQVRPSF